MKKPQPLSDKLQLTHEGYHAYYLALLDYWQWRAELSEKVLREICNGIIAPDLYAEKALKLIEESEK